MRVERIGEALPAFVGERVGVDRRAEQAEAELVAEGVVAIFAVVEQRDAVAVLGEVGEAMGGDLEAGLIPRRVAVGRAADDAVRAFEGRMIGADGEREARLEQDAAVVPVDVGREVDPGGVGPETHGLHDLAVAEAADDPDRGAVRAALDDLERGACGDLLALARDSPPRCPRRPSSRGLST